MRLGFFTLVIVSAFLSGLTVDDIGNRDGKPILALLTSVIALILYAAQILRKPTQQKLHLLFIMGLLLVANGTSFFSTMFLLSNLATYIILDQYVANIDLGERRIRYVVQLMIVTAVAAVIVDQAGVDAEIWSTEKFSQLSIQRLRLFTNEASYLGFLSALLLVSVEKQPIKLIPIALLAATQSAYGLAAAMLLTWRHHIATVFVGSAVVGLGLSLYLVSHDIFIYFQNSVFIRFVGLEILKTSDILELLWGKGLAYSDMALQPLFDILQVEGAASFLFGFVADVGILGFATYYLVFCRNLADIAFLSFLLLNFGASSLYIPLGMYLFQIGQSTLNNTTPNTTRLMFSQKKATN